MTDRSRSPRKLDRLLANAQALFKGGRQRGALGQLWRAEALARGRADELQAVLEVAEGYAGRMERKRDEKDRVLLIRSLRADLDGARGVTSSWAPVPVAATVGARRWWALPPLGLAFLGVLVSMPILLANAGPEFGGLAVIDALLIGAAGFVVGALLSISIWIALVVWRRVARRPAGR